MGKTAMARPQHIKKSLWASVWDGVFASCTGGLTNDYVAPYALALGASTSQIGLLAAFPSLAAATLQLKSAGLAEKFKSRKRVILLFVFLHALMGIPIMFLPMLARHYAVYGLVLLVTLFASCNAFAAPAWAGLMSEYIPPKMRGRYFGWRNKIMISVTVAASCLAGAILHYSGDAPLRGFFLIILLAVACRFVSWYFLTRMYEPAYRAEGAAYFSFLDFLKRAKESNFARFVFSCALFIFCVNVASPFFSVFMLKDLRFSYLMFTAVTVTATVAQVAAMGRWGKYADRVGNLKVIRLSSLLIATLPVWWVINQHPAMLFFAQLLSGFAWAGFNLCTTNFIYDAVTPQKRVRCIAYFNFFIGIATFCGAIVGGYLAPLLPAVNGHKLLTLFLVAAGLRFIASRIFFPGIKEVRRTEPMSSLELFNSVMGLKAFLNYAPMSGQEKEEE